MRSKMNKEIFLRDLRRFLADIPEDEREQALKYYEDYFEDAGPENEQKVIQELGSPVDIAKQIKSTNQENISYGQGNDFFQNKDYPNIYDNGDNNQNNSKRTTDESKQNSWSQNQYNTKDNYDQSAYSQNYGFQNGYNYQQPKKSWTQDSFKVALVIILAILAIPVGIPLVSVVFGIGIAIIAVICSLFFSIFAVGGSLIGSGVFVLAGCFFSTGSIASTLIILGIGLVLLSIGLFIFWFGIVLCRKLFPALGKGIGRLFASIGKGIHSFFN